MTNESRTGGSKSGVVPSILTQHMSNHVRSFLIIFMFGNLLWMIFVAYSVSAWSDFWRIQGTSGLLSGASIISGSLLGFIFGIPRSLAGTQSTVVLPVSVARHTPPPVNAHTPSPNQQDSNLPNANVPGANAPPNIANPTAGDPVPAATTTRSVPDPQSSQQVISSPVAPNTNLEQISDWLTKVLVGVSLTQIDKLPHLLARANAYLAPALNPLPNGGVVGVSICMAYGVAGFCWAYFESRTSLMQVFADS